MKPFVCCNYCANSLVLSEDIPKTASPQNFFWNFWYLRLPLPVHP